MTDVGSIGSLGRKTSVTDKQAKRPSRKEAEAAVRTLLRWAGEDPSREGLADTPKRVALAYEDWFGGYKKDPVKPTAGTRTPGDINAATPSGPPTARIPTT